MEGTHTCRFLRSHASLGNFDCLACVKSHGEVDNKNQQKLETFENFAFTPAHNTTLGSEGSGFSSCHLNPHTKV